MSLYRGPQGRDIFAALSAAMISRARGARYQAISLQNLLRYCPILQKMVVFGCNIGQYRKKYCIFGRFLQYWEYRKKNVLRYWLKLDLKSSLVIFNLIKSRQLPYNTKMKPNKSQFHSSSPAVICHHPTSRYSHRMP